MAGDWIKVEENMPDKPEVAMMAAILGIDDSDCVAGKLLRVWVWASRNCNADGVTNVTAKRFINRAAGVTNFADAMIDAGWLIVQNDSLIFPNFERHCSQTAKDRALNNRRISKHRSKCNADTVTNVTLPPLQNHIPEKRREEISKLHYNATGFPSLDDVKKYAASSPTPIAEPCAIAFFDTQESVGWITKHNQPISNWQAAFRRYASNWNEFDKAKTKQGEQNKKHRAGEYQEDDQPLPIFKP